jgi:RNA polymerase primary sigma factor
LITRPNAAPLELYLSEINSTPLLNTEDERVLARRIATGDPAARDRLVRANLRLVVRLARDYTGRGLPLEDLIAEGNMGLMRAAEAFDPEAGTRFSTYATYWIKQSIRRTLSRDGSAVRLPSYLTTLVAKWRRAADELRRVLDRPATEEEIADHIGLSFRQTRAVRRALCALASGRRSEDPDGDRPLERVACPRGESPAEALADAEEIRKAVGSLAGLSEREGVVLRLRFGLEGHAPATLQEVGERLGYTRERVRQIERDALARLRDVVAA